MHPGMAARFSLDDGATLNVELTADIGKGYVPAVANRPADAPIGLIPVDALYSPCARLAHGATPGRQESSSGLLPSQEHIRVRTPVERPFLCPR